MIRRPDGGEEAVLDGEWITRADAQRIAAESGYELQLDDGFDQKASPRQGTFPRRDGAAEATGLNYAGTSV
jgi:hypothetical protein